MSPVPEILDEVGRLENVGKPAAALALLEVSLTARPRNMALRIERAMVLSRMGHWPTSAEAWTRLVADRAPDLRPKHWSHAVIAQRKNCDPVAAEAVLEAALEHCPQHPTMRRLSAELAMAREDWENATDRWAAYHELRRTTVPTEPVVFPRRPLSSDWYEAAWQEVAQVLHERGIPRQEPFIAGFYLAMARVLLSSGLDTDSAELLTAWLDAPEDAVGDRSVDDVRSVEHVLAGIRLTASDRFPDQLSTENTALLSTLPAAPAPAHGLGRLRLLRVPAGSTIEMALRSTRFISQVNLDRHVRRVARADGWLDAITGHDPLVRRARRWSTWYGEKYAVEPHLPASTLADAMYLTVYHEASQLAPMLRLADDIAGDGTDAPVIIEIPSVRFRYLSGSGDEFSLLYLYFALLERGVNAFLCFFETVRSPRSPPSSPSGPCGASPGGERCWCRRSSAEALDPTPGWPSCRRGSARFPPWPSTFPGRPSTSPGPSSPSTPTTATIRGPRRSPPPRPSTPTTRSSPPSTSR